jgi:hypothetical protein
VGLGSCGGGEERAAGAGGGGGVGGVDADLRVLIK